MAEAFVTALILTLASIAITWHVGRRSFLHSWSAYPLAERAFSQIRERGIENPAYFESAGVRRLKGTSLRRAQLGPLTLMGNQESLRRAAERRQQS